MKKLTAQETRRRLKEIKKWSLVRNKIERKFTFKNFQQTMKFVNKIAYLAEEMNHHPDILIYSWNKAKLILYTHDIGGLSENDFILAFKINRIVKK